MVKKTYEAHMQGTQLELLAVFSYLLVQVFWLCVQVAGLQLYILCNSHKTNWLNRLFSISLKKKVHVIRIEISSQEFLLGLIHTENRLTAIRGEGFGGLHKKGEGIKNKNPSKTDKNMVITRGKGTRGKVEEDKWRISGDGRRLDLR